MIAEWMLYCLLCALGLSVAAALAEQALLAGRRPVRHVWTVAVLLSLAIPTVAFRIASHPAPAPVAIPSVAPDAGDVVMDRGAAAAVSTATPMPVATVPSKVTWGTRLARADQPLTLAWIALSSALGLYLLGGIVALTWMRRRWQQRIVLGVPVLVSEGTGPAIVGTVSPSIVVPEWSLTMEPVQLALMLRHEEEHRRARDGQLLTMAHLALVVMPWNVAVWWQLTRLRVAVELDCDARVLRDTNARSYGDLLLEVARPRRGMRLIGATAFAERATQLERRIRVMARHRDRAVRGGRVIATTIGLAVLSLAWVAPHPAAPVRAAAPSVLTDVKSVATAQPPLQIPRVALDDKPAVVEHDSVVVARRDGTVIARAQNAAARVPAPMNQAPTPVAGVADSPTVVVRDTAAAAQMRVAQAVDAILARLFERITLTPEQEAKARSLLSELNQAQIEQFSAMTKAIAEMLPKRTAIVAQRDSALMALLSSDADRATLATRLRPTGVAGLRSGGAAPDSTGAAQSQVPGARVGRGGPRSGGAGSAMSFPVLVDGQFHRLFDGILLTSEQEGTARAAITKARLDLQRLMPPQPAPILETSGPWQSMMTTVLGVQKPTSLWYLGTVVMQAESEAALMDLLTNDGDREKLRSHIMVARTPAP